jgi:membrane protease YdiL (CAAX protease family)
MTGPETTSGGPVGAGGRKALAAWLVLAALQVGLAFAGAGSREDAADEPLYEYDLAIGSVVLYGILVAITFWIAAAYPDRREALGVRRFSGAWVGAAAGVVVASVIVSVVLEPVLHAGEEQGLSPEVWRPDRAGAFAVNAVVIVTLVPFAEELFFRGLGVRVLGIFGGTAAVAGTGVVFALAHGLIVAVPALLFFALGLAWVRLRSGSVWPGVIAHAAYNGAGIAIAYATIQ